MTKPAFRLDRRRYLGPDRDCQGRTRRAGVRRFAGSRARAVDLGGTLTEALIVAAGAGVADKLAALIDSLGLDVVPLTDARARRAAAAYARWGKRMHPAHLNFGDSFAYALAEEHGCPLLFIGQDFSQTDIAAAI